MSNKRRPSRPGLRIIKPAAEPAPGATDLAWSDEPAAEYPPNVLAFILGKADDPRVNAYVCDTCEQVTITRDVHPGVTPAFLSHGMLGAECEGMTTSAWYRLDQAHGQYATWEWYRPAVPELEELQTKAAGPMPQNATDAQEWAQAGAMVQHVMQGGLMLRRIVK